LLSLSVASMLKLAHSYDFGCRMLNTSRNRTQGDDSCIR